MKSKILAVALVTLATLLAGAPTFAKGETVKITITNLQSGMQIEATDSATVRRFNVWGRCRCHHRRQSPTRRLHHPVVKGRGRSAKPCVSAVSSEVL
jgi:hypothetical protein